MGELNWGAHTRLDLCLLCLANDKLVELLLIFGAEVLQALLGLGGDLELVHCDEEGSVGDGGYDELVVGC